MTSTLRLLVLGGTSWLGGAVAAEAVRRGHAVTCLARGVSGAVPDGAELIAADRWAPGAYDAVAGRSWDGVVEVSWQPELVRSALGALAAAAAHWTYVSSISVYPDHRTVGADESAAVVAPWEGEGEVGREEYAGAKVSCETSTVAALGDDRVCVARAGLIAGYGDRSDRFGYWPRRFARAGSRPVLVPSVGTPVQVIDVEDLAIWLVDVAERRTAGTFDAVGQRHTLSAVLDACATVTQTDPPLVEATDNWLLSSGVEPWAGPESLPLWLPRPDYGGHAARSGVAARTAGLAPRPLLDTVSASLRWEAEVGLDRARSAGLTDVRHDELLRALVSPTGP